MTLTNSDLKEIRSVVKEELDEQLDSKLTQLKSEYFERIDPVLKEVTASREERTIIENRLEKLEGIHPDVKTHLRGVIFSNLNFYSQRFSLLTLLDLNSFKNIYRVG